MIEKTEIEYQTFNVKVPKVLIPFLEKTRKENHNKTIEEELTMRIVYDIRTDMDSTSINTIKQLGVGYIFFEILGDDRFKTK